MDKYEEFRSKYSTFYYHGFEIKDESNYIFVTYDFEIEGLIRFNPTLKVPKDKNIFKELKKENKNIYNLLIEINKENIYEKMLEIYNCIFRWITFKNHIKINY